MQEVSSIRWDLLGELHQGNENYDCYNSQSAAVKISSGSGSYFAQLCCVHVKMSLHSWNEGFAGCSPALSNCVLQSRLSLQAGALCAQVGQRMWCGSMRRPTPNRQPTAWHSRLLKWSTNPKEVESVSSISVRCDLCLLDICLLYQDWYRLLRPPTNEGAKKTAEHSNTVSAVKCSAAFADTQTGVTTFRAMLTSAEAIRV